MHRRGDEINGFAVWSDHRVILGLAANRLGAVRAIRNVENAERYRYGPDYSLERAYIYC